MASVNKVFILGNLGADPEVRYTQNGGAVANLRVATTDVFNDKNGERQERTEWHRIVAFGKTAELCKEYLRKGRSIHVEGRLQTRQWQDKDGQNRYTTEIVADRVTFVGGGRGEGAERGGGERSERPSGPRRESQSYDRDSGPSAFDEAPPQLNDDDIPF